MGTLHELIRYCSEEQHMGALLLSGEWGCGKTHLIETNLREALSTTHFIVRVSMLGVDNTEELNKMIRKRYLEVCTPFLGRLKQQREKSGNLLTALISVLSSLNPLGGHIASAFVSVDPLDYLPLEPVVEDLHNKGVKKKVVLVFDDLNRAPMDWGKFAGIINEYCENKGFTTIVIGNLEMLKADPKTDPMLYKTLREKTIARIVHYLPNLSDAVHEILESDRWQSPEYADFLRANEQKIIDIFTGNLALDESELSQYHNLRSLICALQDFYRLYEFMTAMHTQDISRFLQSFIAYELVSRNGIDKGGIPSFDINDENISLLYPDYSPELVPEAVRRWIENGVWDEESVSEQIAALDA